MTTAGRTSDVVVKLPLAAGVTAELGGKGGWLNRMLSAGLPVPPTAVVTATGYRMFVADSGIRQIIERTRHEPVPAEIVDSAFLAAPIDDRLAEQISACAQSIGRDTNVAVRSSASAEDMAGLSFAGQYRSALDIDSRDADSVLRAVRLTWASL